MGRRCWAGGQPAIGRETGAGTGLGKPMDELGTVQLCHAGQDPIWALDFELQRLGQTRPTGQRKRKFNSLDFFTQPLYRAGRKGVFKVLNRDMKFTAWGAIALLIYSARRGYQGGTLDPKR